MYHRIDIFCHHRIGWVFNIDFSLKMFSSLWVTNCKISEKINFLPNSKCTLLSLYFQTGNKCSMVTLLFVFRTDGNSFRDEHQHSNT